MFIWKFTTVVQTRLNLGVYYTKEQLKVGASICLAINSFKSALKQSTKY